MKRKMRVFLLCGLVLLVTACGKKTNETKPDKKVSDRAVLLDEEYNADVMLLNADEETFRETFKYRMITVDDIDRLAPDKTKSYGCILILDRKGTCGLTKENVKALISFADENRYDIHYLGTSAVSTFRSAGLRDLQDTDVAVTYAPASVDESQSGSNLILGLWNEEDEEMYKEVLTDIIYAKNDLEAKECLGLSKRAMKAFWNT